MASVFQTFQTLIFPTIEIATKSRESYSYFHEISPIWPKKAWLRSKEGRSMQKEWCVFCVPFQGLQFCKNQVIPCSMAKRQTQNCVAPHSFGRFSKANLLADWHLSKLWLFFKVTLWNIFQWDDQSRKASLNCNSWDWESLNSHDAIRTAIKVVCSRIANSFNIQHKQFVIH